jgi:hypothetical protein
VRGVPIAGQAELAWLIRRCLILPPWADTALETKHGHRTLLAGVAVIVAA